MAYSDCATYHYHDRDNNGNSFNPVHAWLVVDGWCAEILEETECERYNGGDRQEDL